MTRPLLSALLCTYDRAPLLERTLASLCEQTLPRDAFEVILVDDGSRDHTGRVVEAYADRLPLVAARQANAGLASARNHALYLARGELVLLVDDDDLAAPDLLERHVEAHARWPDPMSAVLGYTGVSDELAADPLMHFVTEIGRYLFSYPTLRAGTPLDFAHFWGGRSSAKRRTLIDHGVFNPVFRFGCEDVELAYRLSRHGFHVLYEPRAVSTMVRGVDLDGFCRRLFRQGESNLVFFGLHPTAEVRAWAEIDGAVAQWPSLAGRRELLQVAARSLDVLFRRRAAAGVASGAEDLALLHGAYHAAFRAAKLAGIASKAEALHGPGWRQRLGAGR